MSIATVYSAYYDDVDGNQSKQLKCSACDNIIVGDYNFCPFCGAKLRAKKTDNIDKLLNGYLKPHNLYRTNNTIAQNYTKEYRLPKSQYLLNLVKEK
jgi:uncharacterized paraquat-inducible protein A